MTIARVTAVWTGFSGAPGYSNFFFEVAGDVGEQTGAPEIVRGAFATMFSILPNNVTITVSPTVEYVDEATGQLVDYAEADEAPDPIEGTDTGIYSAPSGAVIGWNTGTVRNGRRVRGRTFLVPLGEGAYESDGSLQETALVRLRNFGSRMITTDGQATGFVVWGRPGATPGVVAPVTSYRVPDMAAVLRSRRD